MAKGNDMTGGFGPLVTYMLNGKKIVRTKPRPYKQTRATKASAKTFGLAARNAHEVFKYFLQVIPADHSNRGRLVGLFNKWLQGTDLQELRGLSEVPEMENFQFNKENALSNTFRKLLNVKVTDKQVSINIGSFYPRQIIKAPDGTEKLTCRLIFVSQVIKDYNIHFTLKELEIEYGPGEIPSKEIILGRPEAKAPHLLYLVCSFNWIFGAGYHKNAKADGPNFPMDIVWAGYSGQ